MLRLSLLGLSLVLCSCSPAGDAASAGGGPEGCSDRDGDGAGVGGDCTAADCDDGDPGTIDECGQDCAAYPTRRGCPCSAGLERDCFTGPAEALGVGPCDGGRQYCEGGVWSSCEGARLPAPESCNEEDDDCDGVVDDGVTSTCGDCNVECVEDCAGVGCEDEFTPEENGARAIVQNPDGSLTLSGDAHLDNTLIWVANTQEGTVSKVDTRTREELGRYRTGPSFDPQPTRSTVNLRGDVVVANRVESSATKVLASGCVDQDGDGLHTSAGPGDVLPWGQDDCVVWHAEDMLGARGAAVEVRMELDGPREVVWIGAYNGATVYELDAETGEKTGRTVVDTLPYGLALGPGGKLWTFGNFRSDGGGIFGGGASTIVSIDTTTLERQDIEMEEGENWYGITVDGRGRVWVGGSVAVYDPVTAEWASPALEVRGGGITVDADGTAWTGEYGEAWRIDGDTLEATRVPGAGGHGWAVDADGFVWSIEHSGSRAFVVDPQTLSVDVVSPPFVGAYTYSDMTGFQLVNATSLVGSYPHVFEACDGLGVHWARLTWDADLPAGATIGFRVKTAATSDDLATTPWIPAGTAPADASPIDLDPVLADAGVLGETLLAVEAILQAGAEGARPTLRSLGALHSCARVFE